jgi:hypothetical protein
MRKLGQSLAAVALAIGVSGGVAQAVTVQDYQNTALTSAADLAALCSAKPDDSVGTAAINFCHGYARGAVATYMQREAASRRPLKLFCIPTPAPVPGPTLTAFAEWVKANPQYANDKPVDGLFRFLGITFPCGK